MLRSSYLFTAAALLASLAVAACGGSSSSSSGQTFAVAITNAGCDPSTINAKAGATTFNVTNKSSGGDSEFEILDGTKIVAEVENVAPGLKSALTTNLKAGSFDMSCPGSDKAAKGKLTVTGGVQLTAAQQQANDQAVATYRSYLSQEVDALVQTTTPFVQAIQANDIPGAKTLYPAARSHYESIEPVAESFGDLDPAIDAREDDPLPDGMTWGGFHRLEKALWADNSLEGMGPVAMKLLKDVQTLKSQIPTADIDPTDIANGAVDLLNEVSTSKITGEEERYSHIDLLDFAANVAGSQKAFEAVKPLLAAKDKSLSDQITQRFGSVESSLSAYKSGDGYVSYTQLTQSDTKKLSAAVDALAEPLSKVAKDIVS